MQRLVRWFGCPTSGLWAGLSGANGDPVKIAGSVPIGLSEGIPMKALHVPVRGAFLLVWVVTFLPLPARGRSPDALLPDGVCGSSQSMLEASQAGNAMLQQALAA